jgi:hypothetical protein
MQSYSVERSTMEPIPFSLRMNSGTLSAPAADTAFFQSQQERLFDESLPTHGFLRGFCWAITIEGLAAFFAYEFWHLCLFLR